MAKLNDSIEEYLHGICPWYAMLAVPLNIVWFLPLTMLSSMLVVLLADVYGFINFLRKQDLEKLEVSLQRQARLKEGFALVGFMAATIASLLLVLYFRKILFPSGTFAIGQGMGRHKLLELIRWTVVVSFLVGVAASITATVLAS